MSKVLILGGYGNFGKRIARLLTRHNIPVIIAGRDANKARILAQALPQGLAEMAVFDVRQALSAQLKALDPTVVINTCGPFQTSDYAVAETCIECGAHYIDLADGRDFVTNIRTLDGEAKGNGVAVISGASTVPGLTSAVIAHLRPQFSEINSLDFGIAPGQKAERGLATTKAILGYVGKKLKPCAGYETRYGWQDLHLQNYPKIGSRLMSNCDIPDLDLLPEKYDIRRSVFPQAWKILSYIWAYGRCRGWYAPVSRSICPDVHPPCLPSAIGSTFSVRPMGECMSSWEARTNQVIRLQKRGLSSL